jgi:hypothetical protein
MPAYHHRLPRNAGKLGINDSISNNPETVRFEFGCEFGSGHVRLGFHHNRLTDSNVSWIAGLLRIVNAARAAARRPP